MDEQGWKGARVKRAEVSAVYAKYMRLSEDEQDETGGWGGERTVSGIEQKTRNSAPLLLDAKLLILFLASFWQGISGERRERQGRHKAQVTLKSHDM